MGCGDRTPACLGGLQENQREFHATYAPDGRTLATTVGPDAHQLCLWNVADGTPVGPVLYGHTGPTDDLQFSPDGKMLAPGSDDRTVRLWRVDGAGLPQG
ncbi:WD40 repeat domain-containing protein [Streptomyces xanthophaeus]|uniref:WD40 repeat domain-containing protein n=1 Tax=Streptomyces xanthophaeus TaxID=67385 RepID=UPI00371B26FD